MADVESNVLQVDDRKAAKSPLRVPKPLVLGGSPTSSPYFQKLPPLSPRSMKLIDPTYSISPDFRRASPAELSGRGSTCSGESTASSSMDSECITLTIEGRNQFDFQRKQSESAESNADDIDFFLQVVGVFREYVTDQIQALEVNFSENQLQLERLQKDLKHFEEESSQQESQLIRDIAHMVALLHQKQAQLKDKLKKQNNDVTEEIRGRAEQCRRNMKLISGILCFAKRLRNESGESLRENAVRELKQRLSVIGDMDTPELLRHSEYSTRVDVDSMTRIIERIDLCCGTDKSLVEPSKINNSSAPVIAAAQSDDDVTKSTVTVRWHYSNSDETRYELKWTFSYKDNVVEKMHCDVTANSYVISDLPPNCCVKVAVRISGENEVWSVPAQFRTLPLSAKFSFDGNTAHVKLKLSPDCNTVSYRDDDKTSPKSPSRFTFALNVLGNISFYSGKHYWEVKVNRSGWAVGVAHSGVPRNSWLGSNDSSWILHHNPNKFEYKARHAGEATEVTPDLSSPKNYLKVVGIYLDYEAAIIRFVDPVKDQILHTYTEDRFSEPVCAAVNPFYHGGALTLVSGLDVPKFLRYP